MKILITGAAGFIGSNLTEALLGRGHTVIGLDNLSQGFLLNLKSVLNHRRFRFVEGDIRDEKLVRRLTRGCDVVVHLAAFKIPRYSDAMDTLLINSHGTLAVLQAAAHYGAKVVAASTSDVYGKNPQRAVFGRIRPGDWPPGSQALVVCHFQDVRGAAALCLPRAARPGCGGSALLWRLRAEPASHLVGRASSPFSSMPP